MDSKQCWITSQTSRTNVVLRVQCSFLTAFSPFWKPLSLPTGDCPIAWTLPRFWSVVALPGPAFVLWNRKSSRKLKCHSISSPTLIQSGLRLGWVDLDLGSSPGWWAASVATYCPSRMVEHSKSKSTQPTDKPPAPPCMALMMFVQMLFVIMERVCVKKKDLLLTLPVWLGLSASFYLPLPLYQWFCLFTGTPQWREDNCNIRKNLRNYNCSAFGNGWGSCSCQISIFLENSEVRDT